MKIQTENSNYYVRFQHSLPVVPIRTSINFNHRKIKGTFTPDDGYSHGKSTCIIVKDKDIITERSAKIKGNDKWDREKGRIRSLGKALHSLSNILSNEDIDKFWETYYGRKGK